MTLVIADGDKWWNRAIAAGSKETLPFNTAPWGDRYGQQVDPYGVRWAFNQPPKK
jgi:PhnB protein